jgi:hypothetical protein
MTAAPRRLGDAQVERDELPVQAVDPLAAISGLGHHPLLGEPRQRRRGDAVAEALET